VAGPCEHGKESSGPIKGANFFADSSFGGSEWNTLTDIASR
jgi:hypothetical protein